MLKYAIFKYPNLKRVFNAFSQESIHNRKTA
jgi:hypothetical protein